MMKRWGRFIPVMILVGLAALVPGRTLAEVPVPVRSVLQGLDPETAAGIESLALSTMFKDHSPGLGVGVVEGCTLAYAGYFGFHDLESGRPVGEESIFRIGSMSKSLTAIGLLQQWEAGKFDLDDPINDYLPRALVFSPDPDRPATFRHLLTHTSGSGEFLSYRQVVMKGFGAMVQGTDYLPLEHYLALGFHNRVPPGVKYAYSNYGYSFLGLALETMAGRPFHEYMRERVFLPLGMKTATYQHTTAMEPDIITGYQFQEGQGGYKRVKHQAYGLTPSGNVYSTVGEFGLYMAALLNGGANRFGRVIQPETLALMMDRQHTYDPRQAGYGFAFKVYGDRIWGRRIVGHTGSVPFGYTSIMLLCPEERLGVYVFANCDSGAAGKAGWRILKLLLAGRDEPLPEVEPSRETWPELVGYYGPEYRDFKTSTRIYMDSIGAWRVMVENDRLVLYGAWQGKTAARTLYQVSADDPYYFRIQPGPDDDGPAKYLAFLAGPDGKMRLSPGGLEEYVKLDPGRVTKARAMIPLGRVLAKVNPF